MTNFEQWYNDWSIRNTVKKPNTQQLKMLLYDAWQAGWTRAIQRIAEVQRDEEMVGNPTYKIPFAPSSDQ